MIIIDEWQGLNSTRRGHLLDGRTHKMRPLLIDWFFIYKGKIRATKL